MRAVLARSKSNHHDAKGVKSKIVLSAAALEASTKGHQRADKKININAKKPFGCVYCDGSLSNFASHASDNILYLCLRRGRGVKECRHPRQTCCYCKKRHHFSICENHLSENQNAQSVNNSSNDTMALSSDTSTNPAFLQTATVIVSGSHLEKKIVCLLDGGSQKNFISKALAEELELHVLNQEMLTISTLGSTLPLNPRVMLPRCFNVRWNSCGEENTAMSALEMTNICNNLCQFATGIRRCKEIEGLWIADERLLTGLASHADIDLLISTDVQFGWLLHGPTEHRLNNNGSRTVAMLVGANFPQEEPENQLDLQLSAFLGVRSSRGSRLKRTRKAQRSSMKIWRNQSSSVRPYVENDNLKHYLPHRPVVKRKISSTKVRILFDASARDYNHPSLNDCLEQGPNLNPELLAVMLRFRMKKIAFIGDIEKAFLQIEIAEGDRDAVRFFVD
ncbi:uncharacterized protein LOC130704356 [Daphnia carinata]|uniref:uncharacterized protein LOC130704356 n=1 Tax=Daphnia carinata TaxID=120202 RepID=UPI002579A385|nr:uncharacterized protein LOC130704356 [Daphnia carinata]